MNSTDTHRTVATVCVAVLAVPLALGFGEWVGDTVTTHQASDQATHQGTDHMPYGPTTEDTSAAPWAADTSTDGPDCTPYTYAQHVANVAGGTTYPTYWEDMVATGWYGVDSDGMEALYHPACSVITRDGAYVRSFVA